MTLHPHFPPPGPPGLGPHEAAIAAELRRHNHALSLAVLHLRLRLARRTVSHHLARLQQMGLVELATDPGPLAYQWKADGRPSVYDDVGPTATCPRCGTPAS